MSNPDEKLMVETMHLFSDVFPNQAILKGGMELRLLDCPRYTNDLDYVFIPFESKKEVSKLLVNALPRIDNVCYRFKTKCKNKVMSMDEFIEKLIAVSQRLTQKAIENELRDYLSPEELPGLDKKIKSAINKVIGQL